MTLRLLVLPLAVGVLLCACGQDGPIQRVTIDTPTPATAVTPAGAPSAPAAATPANPGGVAPAAAGGTPLPAPPPTHPPVPVECSPPSPEPASAPKGSNLTFSGACSFTETSRVACSTQPDDFIFQLSRPTPDGPTIYVQVNVEYYKGPGTYQQNVHLLFEIPDNGTIYEWDTLNAGATVDAGGRSGAFDNVVLPADPGTPSKGTITVNGTFACQ